MLSAVANIFAQLDLDRDGEMNFRELLGAYYPSCTVQELDQFIHKYDSSPSTKGGPHGGPGDNRRRELNPEQEEELASFLAIIDQNSDGVLDVQEMALYCANLGIGEETIEEWMAEYDTDKSGTLDLNEMKEFFRKEWIRV
eukprot:TRINITY_DN832_c0_g1_i3.p1 TRINITY_DN832_c0_g1~~TRINITY_DN832_c0_g1_i3.p1  ORF type:complete len:141 (-),score=37.92 TRINITY_DN832_c0_g1_i3:264-686(-)